MLSFTVLFAQQKTPSYEIKQKYFTHDPQLITLTEQDSLDLYSFIARNKYYLRSSVRSRFLSGDTASIWKIAPDYLLAFRGYVDTTITPKLLEIREKKPLPKFQSLRIGNIIDVLQSEAVVKATVLHNFFETEVERTQQSSIVEVVADKIIYTNFDLQPQDTLAFYGLISGYKGYDYTEDSLKIHAWSKTAEMDDYRPGDKILLFLTRTPSVSKALRGQEPTYHPNIFYPIKGTATPSKYLLSEPFYGNDQFVEDLEKLFKEGDINEDMLWKNLK